ncbi:MAG: LuxR C-terminal-related transcriptional regulator [Firmicutes bacterium]|jgi:DNA-binding CsgD family transcriptional regulator/tetratricopeptide (TPR) repeat protein|nr:LuxR C-terminal-related transcriptional regulator [Bacillota bacterium]
MKDIKRVIGREKLHNEINSLLEDSDKKVLLVKGLSGIGKTYGITNISKSNPRVTFVSCKQHHQYITEFSLITSLIDSIMKQVLILPTEKFKPLIYQMRSSLEHELEYIAFFGDVVLKVFKDIKVKQVIDYSRQKYKIRNAIGKFIRLVGNNVEDLCIHLDDLQWTDDNSLDIIKSLLKNKSLNTKIILSYRDEFMGLQKEEKTYGVIDLCPLSEDEVKKVISEQVDTEIMNLDFLGKYIFSITLGNPFYISKVIDELVMKNIIEMNNDKKYIVHGDKLTKSNISENINDIMIERISDLSSNEKVFLEYLSCFGGDISRAYFEKTFKLETKNIIKNLVDKSLIFVTENRYSFTHDIILEYISMSIDKEQKRDISYTIAQNLTESYKIDKSIWPSLVTMIMNSRNIEWSEKETREWFNILSEASDFNVDFQKTKDILILCKEIMDKNIAIYDDRIELNLAKCYYLLGDFDNAKKIYSQMKDYLKGKASLLKICDEEMSMFAYSGNHQEAMDIGIKMLKLLGMEYNIDKMDNLVSSFSNLDNLSSIDVCLEDYESQNQIDEQYVLYRMIPSIRILSNEHFNYCMLLIADIAIKDGRSITKLFSLIACSYIMFNLINNYEIGDQISKVIMKNIDLDSEEEIVQESIAFYLTFVHHWSNDISETIKLLERNNQNCLEKGMINHFQYSLASMMFAYYINGKNINQASIEIKSRIDMLDMISISDIQFSNTYIISVLDNFSKELLGYESIDLKLKEIKIEEMVGIWFRIVAAYINGHIRKAYEAIKVLEAYFKEVKGHIIYSDTIFITTLIMLENYNKLDITQKQSDKKIIDININYLRSIANRQNSNYKSRYYLVKAMYEEIFGDKDISIAYVNKGISIAKERENHLLLVIGYRLGEICSNMLDLENFYTFGFASSIQNYTQSVVKDVNDNLETSTNFSYYYLLQDMKSMNEKEAFECFLNKIVDKKLCSYACVLFKEDHRYKIAYEKNDSVGVVHYTPLKIVNEKSLLDRELLFMSIRLSDTISKKIDNEKLLLASPIKALGVEVGSFYIETRKENENIVRDLLNLFTPILIYKIKRINNDRYGCYSNKDIKMLTPREIEILKYLSSGESNKRISEIESISIGTVKSHLNSIYSKLDVNNRRKAIIVAKELNIL